MSGKSANISNRVLKLLFVRHGQTPSNPLNILQGSHRPETPLSQVGVQQAQLLGSELADLRFTKVITSDYARAIQTTRLILERSKFHSQSCYNLDPRLRERDYGAADGRPLSEFFSDCKKNGMEHFHFVPEGAESYEEVMIRVDSVFQDICKALDYENECENEASALLVSHGGFLLFLMKYFQTQAELGKLQLHSFKPEIAFEMCGNTGVTQINIHPPGDSANQNNIHFRSIYDLSHLSEL